MPVDGFGTSDLNLFISLLILIVSAFTLWWGHLREHRSSVELQSAEAPSKKGGFGGGRVAVDDRAYWKGKDYLRLSNTGEKGAFIHSIDHQLLSFRKENGEEFSDPPAEITRERRRLQQEIEPGQNIVYDPQLKLRPEENVGPLVEHDVAIVHHTMVVEDNKGSYEVSHTSEMHLNGPRNIDEKWEKHQQQRLEE